MKSTRAILVVSALVSLPAFADGSTPSPAPAATPAAPVAKSGAKKGAAEKAVSKPAAGTANMVVTKDPETGELRPATPAERERLLGRRPLVRAEHEVVTLPDGTSMIELGDADMSYAVASRRAGGTVVQGCVHGDAAAKAAVSATPAPAAPAGKSDR
jgi:hypothetical protein